MSKCSVFQKQIRVSPSNHSVIKIVASEKEDSPQNDPEDHFSNKISEHNSTKSSILKSFENYEAEYECNLCDGELFDSETLQQHSITYHKFPHRHQCQQCDETFLKKTFLENHLRKVHSSKFGCQPCDKTFPNENNLISHMEEYHEGNQLEKTFFNPSAFC